MIVVWCIVGAFLVWLVVAGIIYYVMTHKDKDLNVLQRSLLPMVVLMAVLWPFALVSEVWHWIKGDDKE